MIPAGSTPVLRLVSSRVASIRSLRFPALRPHSPWRTSNNIRRHTSTRTPVPLSYAPQLDAELVSEPKLTPEPDIAIIHRSHGAVFQRPAGRTCCQVRISPTLRSQTMLDGQEQSATTDRARGWTPQGARRTPCRLSRRLGCHPAAALTRRTSVLNRAGPPNDRHGELSVRLCDAQHHPPILVRQLDMGRSLLVGL